MSTLDDKLKQLDLEFLHGVPVHLTDEMVQQIKAAFADEGYVDTHFIGDEGDAYYVCHVCGNHVQEKFQQLHATLHDKPELKNYMTGKEWYDKFVIELDETTKYWLFQHFHKDKVKEAAKKASGIL